MVIPTPAFNPDVQPILKADIYGVGHIGPKKDVLAIIENIRQERSNQTAENIRGGVFGAAGYHIAEDYGSDIGASLDQIGLGLHFSPGMGRVEPEKVERNFGVPLEPAATIARVEPVATNTTTPKTPIEAPKGRVGVGTTFTVTPEQAAQVNPVNANTGLFNESTLKALIPEGVSNTFIPSDRIASGYKYDFTKNGINIQIKWHSPDSGAPIGSNSASTWTAQIKFGNKLLGYDGKWYSKPNNFTHIPVNIGK